tara:strand:+ start:205 stop:321 length:117 start_codon:yes stop_codon:yes gene_type:complete
MIKKLIIISIFCILLFSCGRKAEPVYEGNDIPFIKDGD